MRNLSGVPVMQLEIRNALERDRVVYNAAGLSVWAVPIAIYSSRRVFFHDRGGGTASASPSLFALGALGWLDFSPLNMFLNVMTRAHHGDQLFPTACS